MWRRPRRRLEAAEYSGELPLRGKRTSPASRGWRPWGLRPSALAAASRAARAAPNETINQQINYRLISESRSSRRSLARADCVIAARCSEPSGLRTILIGDMATEALVWPRRKRGSASLSSISSSSSVAYW